MKKIDHAVLKQLRNAKGWSQEVLAEKTKFKDLPKIDKQTISRLERGDREKTRGRTIDQLARALKVEPGVLTGDAAVPEMELESELVTPKSQLNVRVSRATRNALNLVTHRYAGLQPSQIVELAPFLFCWAAEASLRHRRDRITQLERALENLRGLECEIWDHLPPPPPELDFSAQQIAAEQQSIDSGDIFGSLINEDPDFSGVFSEDPFTRFLRNLVMDFSDIAKFEEFLSDGTPSYEVCFETAAQLVGGDRDIAAMILQGSVLLNEMPKELRGLGMTKERADWVRAKAEEYAKELENSIGHLNKSEEVST